MTRIKSYCAFTFKTCEPCDWQEHCRKGRETQCKTDETRPPDCDNPALDATDTPTWETCLNCNRCPDDILPMRALVAPLVKSYGENKLAPQLSLF